MGKSVKGAMIRDTALYGAANNIAQLIGVVNSIALRRFMGPTAMGIWSILQVILGYCGYASFGTTKALMRDYPYLRGRGEHEKADQLKDLVWTFSMAGSVIPAVLISLYLVFDWSRLELPLRIGLLFIVLFLFVQRFYDMIMALLRSDKKFTVLSQLIVLNAVLGLGVSFVLVWKWKLYGLLAGTALVTLGCLFFVRKASPYRFRGRWDRPALMKELKLGIPLVATAFLVELLKSMDKWILAQKLSFHDVGLYSIAMMASSYVYSFPMMFAHVWYPHLQEEYGRKGNASGIGDYLLKPVLALSVLCPFLAGLAIFLIPVLIHIFLPLFTAGVLPMKIYLVGTFFILLAQFGGNFLVTLDRYLVNIPILLVSLALNFVLNLNFINLGWGLPGVALGSVCSFIFYGIVSYGVALKHISSVPEVVVRIGKLTVLLGIFFGGIFMLDQWVRTPNLYTSCALKVILFLAFSAPFFYALEKKTKVLSPLLEALGGKNRG